MKEALISAIKLWTPSMCDPWHDYTTPTVRNVCPFAVLFLDLWIFGLSSFLCDTRESKGHLDVMSLRSIVSAVMIRFSALLPIT